MTDIIREYFPIPVPGRDGKSEEMEVRLGYSLGGINYMNGKTERRGIWLYLTPVTRTATSTSRLLMDERGRKILVRELARRSARAEGEVADQLTPILKDLAEAAMRQDWGSVAELVRQTTQASA